MESRPEDDQREQIVTESDCTCVWSPLADPSGEETSFQKRLETVDEEFHAYDSEAAPDHRRYTHLECFSISGRLYLDDYISREAERFLRCSAHWTFELVLYAPEVTLGMKRFPATSNRGRVANERLETNWTIIIRHNHRTFFISNHESDGKDKRL